MIQNSFPPRQKDVVEVLEQTILEYEKKTEKLKLIIRELERGLECESQEEFEDDKWELDNLVRYLLRFLQIFDKSEFSAEGKNPRISVLLQKISWLYPRETKYGNTLLHLAVDGENSVIKPPHQFPCAKTVKLLLIAGINVNAVNNNGDKPLHRAACNF